MPPVRTLEKHSTLNEVKNNFFCFFVFKTAKFRARKTRLSNSREINEVVSFFFWLSHSSCFRFRKKSVKKCYGCGDNFAEKFRQPPHNIVVKHVDRRQVRKDDNTEGRGTV